MGDGVDERGAKSRIEEYEEKYTLDVDNDSIQSSDYHRTAEVGEDLNPAAVDNDDGNANRNHFEKLKLPDMLPDASF
ncbi:hypothetical protein [Parasitella parasitica]|uniref:Uncharacterized protein n=1 Tax=Parasitella parasitica TaxID=35722 RepID=A0A0B7NQQ2_9FUNG|nr:hypothetical protein [Parasitella parasitica]